MRVALRSGKRVRTLAFFALQFAKQIAKQHDLSATSDSHPSQRTRPSCCLQLRGLRELRGSNTHAPVGLQRHISMTMTMTMTMTTCHGVAINAKPDGVGEAGLLLGEPGPSLGGFARVRGALDDLLEGVVGGSR